MIEMMDCLKCHKTLVKNGKSKNGTQRYYCKACKKYCQESYLYIACTKGINDKIVVLKKESCGIRSISRILKISAVTVIKRVLRIARSVTRPFSILRGNEYEVDEMRTYIGNKKKLCWIVYAICKDTKKVIDFKVGKRTLETLQSVTSTVLLSGAKKIYTDGFRLYQSLIPKEIHCRSAYRINHIERKNLDIRTHLKRLGRKIICFSKSKVMLEACLKIYFWGTVWAIC